MPQLYANLFRSVARVAVALTFLLLPVLAQAHPTDLLRDKNVRNTFQKLAKESKSKMPLKVTPYIEEDYYRHVKIGKFYYDLDKENHIAIVVPETYIDKDSFVDNYYDNLLSPEDYDYISGSISIPTHVTYYGIEYTVTQIGVGAFAFCSLSSVSIPDTVVEIADCAFFGTTLTDIEIPDDVWYLGEYCFFNSDLTGSLKLPSGLFWIDDFCFAECQYLEDIQFPEVLGILGMGAFLSSGLESVYIPADLTSIGFGAFSGCINMKSFYVHPDNEYYKVYKNCLYSDDCKVLLCVPGLLSSLDLPTDIEVIQSFACYGNSKITEVDMSNTQLEAIGYYAFAFCDALENIYFSNETTFIGEYAFYYVEEISELYLPANLETLEEGAFESCYSLKNIFIGDRIQEIGIWAFWSCYNLVKITIDAVVPPSLSNYAFYEYEGITLVVPVGRTRAYSSAEGWMNFYNITDDPSGVGEISTDIDDDSEVYDLQGRRIDIPKQDLPKGIYVVRKGNKPAKKILIK